MEALAIGEGIPAPAVYVIDDPSPNAFATGVSPEKAAITYTTGLLAIMNREELEGVTGHEMSHIKNHDIRLLLMVGTLIGMAALLASILWRSAFFAGGGRNNQGGQLVLVIIAAGALLAVVGFIFGPLIRLALSRRRESLADVSGVELTRNPAGLLSALRKLQTNDKPFKKMNHATAAMCIDDPLQHHETWVHRLYDTHPPIEERIAALEKIASGPVGLRQPVCRSASLGRVSRPAADRRCRRRPGGHRRRWPGAGRPAPGLRRSPPRTRGRRPRGPPGRPRRPGRRPRP